MENNLPKGWETPLLEDVVTIKSGNSKLTKKEYIPDGKYTAFSGTGPDGKTAFYEHKGDAIILSAVGARCGKCFRASGKWTAIANTSIIRAKTDNRDVYRYLFYMFNNENFWPKGGTGQPFVKSGVALKEMRIPFPPIPQQKRIADKLDALLAKVKDAQSRLDKIPTILGRFRQSVLSSACSGKLTADWRAEKRINSDEWPMVILGEVADLRLGKMLDKIKNIGHPTRYLRNINVRWFAFDLSDVAFMKATEKDKKELAIKDGDLLVCEGGEPGRCAVWNSGNNDLIFQKAIHRVRPIGEISPYWLALNIRNDAISGSLDEYFTGTTIKHLTGKALARYKFVNPPLVEQQEIIRRAKLLFSFTDKIEDRYNKGKLFTDKLEQSILAKAFRGELVS